MKQIKDLTVVSLKLCQLQLNTAKLATWVDFFFFFWGGYVYSSVLQTGEYIMKMKENEERERQREREREREREKERGFDV